MAGDETFSGALSVVSGEGDKFTVTRSGGEDGDQTVDIFFANSSKIFVTRASGSTEGTTFDKIQ